MKFQNHAVVKIPIENNLICPSAFCGKNIKSTLEGGIAVKLINKTGANSVKGYTVGIHRTVDSAVRLTIQDVPDCFGVFLNSGIPDGSYAWVVITGIAEVFFVSNATRGYLARTFITADGDYETGKAKAEAVPSSPFVSDKHFSEIGHVLESRVGAGLSKCILHFN